MSVLAHNNKIIVTPNRKALLPPQSGREELPAGYTEVEYLESDGTGYIPMTDTMVNDLYEIEVTFSPAGANGQIFGVIENIASADHFYSMSYNPTSNWIASYTGLGTDNYKMTSDPIVGFPATVTLGKGYIIVNGRRTEATDSLVGAYTAYPFLFARRKKDGNPEGLLKCKISGVRDIYGKIWLCTRDSDSVPGLYMQITQKFYPSIGGITAGPEIITAQDLLARLEAIL